MNFSLLKNVAQNSKKCNKTLFNLINQDGSCISNSIRHGSNVLGSYTRCLPGQVSLDRTLRRCYCQESGPPASSKKLPPLMNFPTIVWPSLLKSLKNLILTTFIIKPYFDVEFSLPEFVQASKKAVEVVSHRLSEGQDLEGLVTQDVIPMLQDGVSKMSLAQRDLIPVEVEDIYFSFPYQIGVMFTNEESDVQKRFVEITMVYHVLRGLSKMRSQGEEPPLNVGMLPEYQDKISICNYRFVREYTKGKDSRWIVNLLNHFRPSDEMEQ